MEQTIEKLLHQEFSKKARGYDRDEVDNFLDEVIEDIEKLQKKYELLLDEKKILEKNNFELKMKMLGMEEKMNSMQIASHNTMQDATRLITPQPIQQPIQQPVQQAPVYEEPVRRQFAQPNLTATPNLTANQTQAYRQVESTTPTVQENTMEFNHDFGQAVIHEDSKANDHTLQDRIEQLEKELNNIKNFSE